MKHLLLSILLGLAFVAGCGDDDGGDEGGADDGGSNASHDGGGEPDAGGGATDDGGPSPTAVSKRITAAEGGEVSTDGASITIPAGALAADTTITIEEVDADTLPAAADVASPAYELGPDGTTFEMPVTLTLEFDGDVPEGKQAVLAWLDGDRWQPLEDSELGTGSVTASTTHFTTFAVLFISGQGQVAGACDVEGFEACGGDLVGPCACSRA